MVCKTLRDFRKVHKMSYDGLFVWKSYWKQLGWAHKFRGAGSQGMTRVEQTVLAKLLETEIWHLPKSECWARGGLN